jgi:hypothetical protein
MRKEAGRDLAFVQIPSNWRSRTPLLFWADTANYGSRRSAIGRNLHRWEEMSRCMHHLPWLFGGPFERWAAVKAAISALTNQRILKG